MAATRNKTSPEVHTEVAAWDLSQVFRYQGQRVAYGVLGSGPPLVLLHGTPFSSLVWRRIAPYLAPHRRVYYFDLLGYGQSEQREGQDVSLGAQTEVFAALLTYWQLKQPDVVAHDFGGTTALRAHLLKHCDYRSLTLIDPVALSPSGSGFVQAAKNHELVFRGLPAYMHEAMMRAYIGQATATPLAEDVMQGYLAPWLGEAGQAALYRQIAQMSDCFTDEIQDRYHELRCPVALVWGKQDVWLPLDRGEELARRIPQASLQVISPAGHLVQEDAPEAIVAAVLGVL